MIDTCDYEDNPRAQETTGKYQGQDVAYVKLGYQGILESENETKIH